VTSTEAEFALSEESLDDRTHVIGVAGHVDLFTAPELKQRLVDTIEGGKTHVVVDLEQARSIDSTTLGVLISAVKRLRVRDGNLAVAAQDPTIVKTFRITGLDEVFPVAPTRGQALARLREA